MSDSTKERFVVRPRKGRNFLDEAMTTFYPSKACPSKLAGPFLSADPADVILKCGLSKGHEGDHEVYVTWEDSAALDQEKVT
jgi:hypothetical protein